MAQYASTTTGKNLYKAVVEVARMRHCDPDTMGDHIKIAVTLGWFVNEGRIKNRKSNTYHLAIPADHPVYVRADAMAAEDVARRALTDKSGRKPLVAVDIPDKYANYDPRAAAMLRDRDARQ